MKVFDLLRTKAFRVFCVLMLTNIRPVSGSGVSLASWPWSESQSYKRFKWEEIRDTSIVSHASHGQFYVSFISPPVVKKYLNVAKQWFPHYTQKVRSEKCFWAYKDNSTFNTDVINKDKSGTVFQGQVNSNKHGTGSRFLENISNQFSIHRNSK